MMLQQQTTNLLQRRETKKTIRNVFICLSFRLSTCPRFLAIRCLRVLCGFLPPVCVRVYVCTRVGVFVRVFVRVVCVSSLCMYSHVVS